MRSLLGILGVAVWLGASSAQAQGPVLPVHPADPMPPDYTEFGAAIPLLPGVGPVGPDWREELHPLYRFRGQWLVWFTKDMPTGPPLATTVQPDGSPVLLIGNSSFDFAALCGARFFFARDWGPKAGIEAGFFFMATGQETQAVSSDQRGVPTIRRPFLSIDPDVPQSAYVVAAPDLLSGNVSAHAESTLWGAEVNWTWHLGPPAPTTVDFLLGYRHVNLQESLMVSSSSVVLFPDGRAMFPASGGLILGPGDLINVNDNFTTRNFFHGGQVGFRCERGWGPFHVAALAKVAFGVSHETVDVLGNSVGIQFANGRFHRFTAQPVGLLAVGSNSGHSSREVFAVVPELNLQVGWCLSKNFRALLGYDFLYWSNVLRPGDQVSLVLNPQQTPLSPAFGIPDGILAPVIPYNSASYWAQGLTLGLEFRY